MSNSSRPSSTPACGCGRSCRCYRELRCRCHDLNAFLALALWDYSRMLRRRRTR
jgi:hypothetical protein